MSWLSTVFDKFSYPKKISTLSTPTSGARINNACRKDVAAYSSYSYDTSVYAKRNFDNSYNINFKRTGNSDDGTYTLYKSIKLPEVIKILSRYDNQTEAFKKGNKLKINRKYNNIKNVKARLSKKGVLKY